MKLDQLQAMALAIALVAAGGCNKDKDDDDVVADDDDAADDDDTGDDDTVDPCDDALFDQVVARAQLQIDEWDVPGLSIAVAVDGQLACAEGLGVTRYDDGDPVTTETVFRWASVSKMHTAAAMMRMVEEDFIDLHAPVTDTFPEFQLEPPFEAEDLTTHMLLTHGAALPDELPWSCATADGLLSYYYANTFVPPLYGDPGVFFNYSNSGFNLSGAMLEELTGQYFIDLMDELVLEPAGMTHATYDATVAEATEHATGTEWWNGAPYHYELGPSDCCRSRPAGWLHGTASDLIHYAEMHLSGGGDVLSEASVQAMWDQEDTYWYPDGSYRVGYGLFSYPYKGVDVVMHDGWVTGFVSTWAIVPERGFAVAVVANADWADPYDIMNGAMDIFLDLPDDPAPEYLTDPSTWGVYEGTYEDPYVMGTVVVYRDGDQLYATFEDQAVQVELFQWAGDAFSYYIDGYWEYVNFIFDGQEVAQYFVTRPAVAIRAEDGEEPPPPAMSPGEFRGQMRRYGLSSRPSYPMPSRM